MLNVTVAMVTGPTSGLPDPDGSIQRRMNSKTMGVILLAVLVATTLLCGMSAAFASSNAYPGDPMQTVVASPPTNAGFAAVYQQTGPVMTQLSAATAVNNASSQREPEFSGAKTTYGTASPAVAHRSPAQING